MSNENFLLSIRANLKKTNSNVNENSKSMVFDNTPKQEKQDDNNIENRPRKLTIADRAKAMMRASNTNQINKNINPTINTNNLGDKGLSKPIDVKKEEESNKKIINNNNNQLSNNNNVNNNKELNSNNQISNNNKNVNTELNSNLKPNINQNQSKTNNNLNQNLNQNLNEGVNKNINQSLNQNKDNEKKEENDNNKKEDDIDLNLNINELLSPKKKLPQIEKFETKDSQSIKSQVQKFEKKDSAFKSQLEIFDKKVENKHQIHNPIIENKEVKKEENKKEEKKEEIKEEEKKEEIKEEEKKEKIKEEDKKEVKKEENKKDEKIAEIKEDKKEENKKEEKKEEEKKEAKKEEKKEEKKKEEINPQIQQTKIEEMKNNLEKKEVLRTKPNIFEEYSKSKMMNNALEKKLEEEEESKKKINIQPENLTNIKEEDIKNFFTGPYKNSSNNQKDISYEKWVLKNENIKLLCQEIKLTKNKIDNIFEEHDFECEFKLLNWITNDSEHRNNLVDNSPEIKTKNRYQEIRPFNFNKVELKNNKYLNASYIDGPFENIDNKLFIAMQNPLPEDFELFWEMILEKNIQLIVLLSGNFEEERMKIESYWPEEGLSLQFNSIKIELEKKEIFINNFAGTRQFKVIKGDKIHEVSQVYVQCWDENNIPSDIPSLIFNYIIMEMEKVDKKNPILIHSLGGSGRVGTVIAIYNIYRCILAQKKKNVNEPIINIFNVIRILREQRIGMVSSANQYRYILKYCLEYV